MKKFLPFLLLLFCALSMQAQQSARALAERIMGRKADQVQFVLRPDSTDYFTLGQQDGKVCITANNDNSMAVGLNYYLRNCVRTHVSWYAADPVELPARLPEVDSTITRRASSQARFFLNYCTFGYTMVWWKWPQWERFIDWMALNGVNMPLALTGQEAVWQEVWREMGLTDEEIRSYFSGPAHLPWHRMANLDGFGGPLPQSWIDGQRELQQQILERERSLGMTPVLPAFAGHVPQRLAQLRPQADIQRLNGWCGFEPTCFLNATDTLFATIQRLYLEKQSALYGTNHIYGIDPFNEMDPPSWEPDYLAGVSRSIYASLQQVDSAARWLQMGWVFYYKRKQWTPERLQAYLTAVPQGRMILLDYFCENTEVWRTTEAFYGQPFIWCYLGNFGGNSVPVGNAHEIHRRLSRTLQDQPGNMLGIGSTLEAFGSYPHIYEFLLEQPWQLSDSASRVRDFARRWADCRYGKADNGCRAAWQLLMDSVFVDPAFYGLGCQMTARPSLTGHGTYYTKPFHSYDDETLLRAVRLMMVSPSRRTGYQSDVACLTAQWAGNYFADIRDAFAHCHKSGDVESMEYCRNVALDLLDHTDWLLMQIRPNFWTWTQDARDWGHSRAEKDYYETQARTLLGIWGGPVLNDYANRLWGGLLRGYYGIRWEQFFEAVIASHTGRRPFDAHAFDSTLARYEQAWATESWWQGYMYTEEPAAQVAKKLLRSVDRGDYDVFNPAADKLRVYMRRYPEAQLRDVYKFLFQDVFGPGHLIADATHCAQSVLEEMELLTPADTLFADYEYAGMEGDYVRVSLRVIQDGRVPLQQFVDLLMQSAKTPPRMPLYDWKGEWQHYLGLLRKSDLRPHNFDADAAEIQAVLDSGQYAVHHSARFNQAYHPHYRLIRQDLFEQQILPLLSK